MYSYEDRMRAVKLYIKYDFSYASVKHELGFPKHSDSLRKWYKEYQENSDLHEKYLKKSKDVSHSCFRF